MASQIGPESIRFGTDGVRGIIDVEINDLVVAVVAEAAIRYFERKTGLNKVIVSYDNRRKSRDYALVISSVVEKSGLEFCIVDSPTPTPVVSWSIREMKFDLGFQVTASHNPPEYNGIKILNRFGASIVDEDARGIERVLRDEFNDILRSIRGLLVGSVNFIDVRTPYIEHVVSDLSNRFKARRELRIVVDPMYGTAIGYTNVILERLGFKVSMIHDKFDPSFGGLTPEPVPENLRELADVTRGGFDMGIAHDGDADRATIYLPDVGFLGGNEVLSVLLYRLAKRGLISSAARTVATTHLVDDICRRFNIRLHETPVGIKYLGDLLLRGEIDVGGEESGGMVFRWHLPEKDGIYTAAMLVLMHAEESISSTIREMEREFGRRHYRRVNIKHEQARDFVKTRRDDIAKLLTSLKRAESIITIDGIKVVYSDGSWALVRASGTEKTIRVYAESRSEDDLNNIINSIVSALRSLQ